MKTIVNGSGQDVTATVVAALRASKTVRLAHLYLIGEADDPLAYWLTDYESPLCWPWWGTFQSSVITRGSITSKIGLEAEAVDLTWAPRNKALTSSLATANPYQLARLGVFSNKRVRIWRCYMPNPGDANTWGAAPLFGGFIGDAQVTRSAVRFSVNSYLYVLNQKVPSQVIEVTNTLASYSCGTPPPGFSVIPQFSVFTGSTQSVIYCDQVTPNPGGIPDVNTMNDGYIVFNGGAGATLQGSFSIIGKNGFYNDGSGNKHTVLQLYSPLPWAPTPGVDTFYVSGASPVAQSDGDYYGFPYVPAPETAA